MKPYLFIVVVSLTPVLPLSHYGQVPCDSLNPGLLYRLPRPKERPPVSMYMPYDVLVGYVALDTFQRNIKVLTQESRLFHQFILRQNLWNDTLRKIVRSWYAMADYDPMLFEASMWNFRGNEQAPIQIREEVCQNIQKLYTHDIQRMRLDFALLNSHYILHIKVMDTVHIGHHPRYDPYGELNPIVVTVKVIERIKGRVAPLCQTSFIRCGWAILQNLPIVNVDSGTCIQFEYIPEWYRIDDGDVNNTTERIEPIRLGEIIVPTKEYLIFLWYALQCRVTDGSDNADYYYLFPIRIPSSQANPSSCGYAIYPIVDGIVEDPADDFGFGSGLTVEQFKQRLRARIEEIRNW